MEAGDIRAAGEVEVAILVISEDQPAGSCIVQLPRDSDIQFESIGRDDDGGFLRTVDGTVMRLNADIDELDELLSKDEVFIQQLDEHSAFVSEYPVNALPYEHGMGFTA